MQQDIPGTIDFRWSGSAEGLGAQSDVLTRSTARKIAPLSSKDEDAYCRKYGLNAEQRAAVKSRSVLKMIEAGGNVYYLAKLAGIFGLNVQDIGAQQTGMTVEAFKSKLLSAGA